MHHSGTESAIHSRSLGGEGESGSLLPNVRVYVIQPVSKSALASLPVYTSVLMQCVSHLGILRNTFTPVLDAPKLPSLAPQTFPYATVPPLMPLSSQVSLAVCSLYPHHVSPVLFQL